MKVKRLMHSIVLATIFLTAIWIGCTDLPPSGVILYSFDQNPQDPLKVTNGSPFTTFGVRDLEKGKRWSGYVKNMVDGDTVDVSFNICGIPRIRLVGIDAPEIGEEGYEEAKAFVNRTCIGEEFKLDVDDMRQYDTHYRILAVVYVNGTNLSEKMVREGYAEVMYIPPSEFNSREWEE
jgi:endonuclease YncB( thermonuclease family)